MRVPYIYMMLHLTTVVYSFIECVWLFELEYIKKAISRLRVYSIRGYIPKYVDARVTYSCESFAYFEEWNTLDGYEFTQEM